VESSKFSFPSPIFVEGLTCSKTKNHPPTLIKSALEQYATKHHLTDRAEPRYLLLDEELGRACGVKKPVPGTKMSRDETMGKLRNGVVWSVSVGGVVKYVLFSSPSFTCLSAIIKLLFPSFTLIPCRSLLVQYSLSRRDVLI
jgi:hypothetical protein